MKQICANREMSSSGNALKNTLDDLKSQFGKSSVFGMTVGALPAHDSGHWPIAREIEHAIPIVQDLFEHVSGMENAFGKSERQINAEREAIEHRNKSLEDTLKIQASYKIFNSTCTCRVLESVPATLKKSNSAIGLRIRRTLSALMINTTRTQRYRGYSS